MKKQITLEKIKIHGIADRGKGVGRTSEGVTVFIEGGVPGDVVDVRLQKKKKDFAEGIVVHFHEKSTDRVEPFCQHFEYCGGCKWQNLSYKSQLLHKQKVVEDAMHRIGKVEIGQFDPILGAEETRFYRNKLEFTFSNKRWLPPEAFAAGEDKYVNSLGFHRAGSFDTVLPIEECWLMSEPTNHLRNGVRDIAEAQELSCWDARIHKGFLRNMLVRLTTTGELMVVFSVAPAKKAQIDTFLNAVLEKFPEITTMFYCVNGKVNDFILDLDFHLVKGKGFIEELLGDLRFNIGPKSFFQTNTRQGKQLYDTVIEFAGLTGNENVYDLYTGTGSIALYLARFCQKVVGIEEIPAAIDDARINQEMNKITNATFYAGDVKDILSPEFLEKHGRPDLIVTDPPRAGMHPKAVGWLLELAAPRIVYVSCNPATQARDLQMLSEKYRVSRLRPVDMFPHTHHIESVAMLELI
jgi:23S rRNA (uracil1939-C5)-methyltransferase